MERSTEHLYLNEHAGVRPSFASDQEGALRYYARFVEFVVRVAPPSVGTKNLCLLDVGCGSGWSTYALTLAGYDATGIDLNARAFEAPPAAHLHLREGSASSIPFPEETFDVVVSFQVIEHIPVPEKALQEMARVCRRGGVLCVVGPNLLSPLVPVLYLLKPSSWRRMTYRRNPGMPSHPYGNTLWEILASAPLRTGQLIGKLLSREPQFTMRVPDTVPPFQSDNDACYLCNPRDIIDWFRSSGWTVLRKGRHGRLALTYLVAGGTWVGARKP